MITPPVRHDQEMTWDVHGISLGVFSKMINPGLPVLDRTGLSGTFDIHLEFSIDPPATDSGTGASDPPGSSLVESLRKQLGLKLVRGRGPREFLVIDHVEKPSEN